MLNKLNKISYKLSMYRYMSKEQTKTYIKKAKKIKSFLHGGRIVILVSFFIINAVLLLFSKAFFGSISPQGFLIILILSFSYLLFMVRSHIKGYHKYELKMAKKYDKKINKEHKELISLYLDKTIKDLKKIAPYLKTKSDLFIFNKAYINLIIANEDNCLSEKELIKLIEKEFRLIKKSIKKRLK